MGQNIYIYPIQLTVVLYEFLGGLVGVWFRIYIYIAIPKVVRVWHFTVGTDTVGSYPRVSTGALAQSVDAGERAIALLDLLLAD